MSDCSITSMGKTPINDLATGFYLGEQGDLYPGGSNVRPGAYIAPAIAPVRGVIGLASLGMSNTQIEFGTLQHLVQANAKINPAVKLANGAISGASLHDWLDPNAFAWQQFASSVTFAGIAADQLQCVWIKHAYRLGDPELPSGTQFPNDALKVRDGLQTVIFNLTAKFPSVKQIFISSRIYAGYAGSGGLNPEPYAYQSAFGVKWAIQNYIAAGGNPWVAWGPYLWADGETPRSDGLVWHCSDFGSDGTHPSPAGAMKVANMLLTFFLTDPATAPWFAVGAPVPPVPPPTPTPLTTTVDLSTYRGVLTFTDGKLTGKS